MINIVEGQATKSGDNYNTKKQFVLSFVRQFRLEDLKKKNLLQVKYRNSCPVIKLIYYIVREDCKLFYSL